MHKSVYASIFLMASLLILLVPFASTNTNNFSNSNVVPQAYGEKYRSDYPTDDYKYECRTGPFEGFFVSSVEFCLAFDDDEKKKKDRLIVEEPPVPPTTPPTATLSVKKTVTCTSNSAFPLTVQACETILNTILPSSFNIVVTSNNLNPSAEFAGSTVPVVVTLGAGDYRVTESAVAPPVIPGISIIQEENFAGNCIEDGFDSLSAIGTIAAGEFQTCDISNDFTARLFD